MSLDLKDILDQYNHEFKQRYAGKYYGKYAAIVVDIQDPMQIGRIKVRCPALFGAGVVSQWCFPTSPFGGNDRTNLHGTMILPVVGDMVWIELEEGNPQKPPIWTGGPWSKDSTPLHPRAAPDESDEMSVKGVGIIPESNFNASEYGKVRVFQMPSGSRIEFDETEGSERVLVYHTKGALIEILPDGTIQIGATGDLRLQASDGAIKMYGANGIQQDIPGSSGRTVGGDWSETTAGSHRSTITGAREEVANTHDYEVAGDVGRRIGGTITETVMGKEQRTISSQSSTMVGTDWFVQAAGAVSLVGQNAGGLDPAVLGAELSAMNSRALVQSTDATGLASKASLDLLGVPGAADLEATATVVVAAPLITLGSAPFGVGAVHTTVNGEILFSMLNAMILIFDTHIHPAMGNAPPPPPMQMSPNPFIGGAIATLQNPKVIHGP